jgi:hypothetical protein
MKRTLPTGSNEPFKGSVRHYHRIGQPPKSWDEWVDGRGANSLGFKNGLKILGIVVSILALLGILVGLFIELS